MANLRCFGFLFAIALLFFACAPSVSVASIQDVFSLDFEDGFQASTGNELMCKYGIDAGGIRADDTEIRIVYDADKDSNVVQVGVGTIPTITAMLNYFTGIYTFSRTGEVTLTFKMTDDYTSNDTTTFFTNVISTYYANDYWSIGLYNKSKVIAVSYNNTIGASGANQKNYTADIPALTNGWHTMKFTWEQTVAQTTTDREQANIRMYIDDMDTPVLSQDNVYWSMPGGGNVCIGSRANILSSGYTTSYEAGGAGHSILLDDIVVRGEPTTLTPALGKGTQTFSYDAEDGFTPSTMPGTEIYAYDKNTGLITDPCDATQSICTLYNAVKGNRVLKVGSGTTSTAYMAWRNLDYTFAPVNGRIKCSFLMPDAYLGGSSTKYANLWTLKVDEPVNNYWRLCWIGRSYLFLRNHNTGNATREHTYQIRSLGIPYDGKWHTMELAWQEVTPFVQGGSAGTANAWLYMDGYLIADLPNIDWGRPRNTLFEPGNFSYRASPTSEPTVSNNCGVQGILLDDFVVEAIPVVCGDVGTVYLDGDINKDCEVDMNDAAVFADQWLACTNPAGGSCVKAPLELAASLNYNAPQSSSITVDGDLSDWSDAVWANIPYAYSFYPDPPDVSSALYAVKWNDAADKLYIAVKVVDTDPNIGPHLRDEVGNIARDSISIYSRGDNGIGYFDDTAYTDAQVFQVGANGSGGTWKVWEDGDANYVPIVAATSVVGNEIWYEVEVTPYETCNIKTTWDPGQATPTVLTNGKTVALDVHVTSMYTPVDVASYGFLSSNLKISGYYYGNITTGWNRVTCLNNLGTNCGTWGYNQADVDKNCKIDLADFAQAAAGWADCSNPVDANCNQYWY